MRRSAVALDDQTSRGIRDRSIMLLGFAGGFRRSELANLDLSDIQFGEKGVRVIVRYSKTDQEAKGRTVGIFKGPHAETCPVRALRSWLKLRGEDAGPLFCWVERFGRCFVDKRISRGMVNIAVKRAAERIGLDPERLGAHSLRAGMITTATELGASPFVIMARTGHKSLAAVQRYVRSASVFSVDPLARAL